MKSIQLTPLARAHIELTSVRVDELLDRARELRDGAMALVAAEAGVAVADVEALEQRGGDMYLRLRETLTPPNGTHSEEIVSAGAT